MSVLKWARLAAVTSALLLIGAIFMYPEEPAPHVNQPASIPVKRIAQEPVPFFASAEESESDPLPVPVVPEQPKQIISDVWTGPVFWDFQSMLYGRPEPSVMQIALGGFENVKGKAPARVFKTHRIISPRPLPQRIDPDE